MLSQRYPVILILLAYVGYSSQQQPETESPCPNNPCKNGATCFYGGEDLGSYFCLCSKGFEGTTCEHYNVCIGQGPLCYNGGTCINNDTLPLGYECDCLMQFEGDRCQTLKVDVCTAQKPCQNGGTCLLNSGLTLGYQCQCASQFEGTNCQTMIPDDVCASTPCMNGGTCFRAFGGETPGSLSYLCVCRPGYNGLRCEEAPVGDVDICDSVQPCLNGGTCFVSSSNNWSYICMCEEGFTGNQCETSNIPDLCLSNNPCQNNSTCVHLTGASSVTCQCAPGYVGEYCNRVDTGSGPCLPNPCVNGGTCNPDPFVSIGFTCSCLPTFSGINCELEYFGCDSNPCQNSGTCVVHTYGAYYCQCPEGYVGRLCENAGPCASSPCLNNGTCMENPQVRDPEVRAYNCICSPGYMGLHCDHQPFEDPCDPNPCRSGTCYKSDQTLDDPYFTPFFCVCPEETVGILCDDDPCLSVPCMNGGTCNPIFHPTTRELVAVGCICPAGYTGPTCAVVGPCQSNPCQNGGTCIDSTGSSPDPLMDWGAPIQPAMLAFFCMCPPEWTGTTCSETSDPCASNPCQNNGMCVRIEESGFTCICQELYAGPRCETRVDPCSPNPCMNSGSCIVTGSSYTCVCTQPFVGSHCERSDPCASSPCLNNATCFRSWQNEQIICQCAEGYTGTYCQDIINFCISRPCQNGGTCYTGLNSFVCICTEAYSGYLCSDLVSTTTATTEPTSVMPTTQPITDACRPNPCLNGGTCLPIGSGLFSYTCLCPRHFAGLTCAVYLEQTGMCDPNPCLNGGTCMLLAKTGSSGEEYFCLCGNGFAGNTCALFVETCDVTKNWNAFSSILFSAQMVVIAYMHWLPIWKFPQLMIIWIIVSGPSTTTAGPTTTRHATTTLSTTTMEHATTTWQEASSTVSPTQDMSSSTRKVVSSTEEVTSRRGSADVETTTNTEGTSTNEPQICFHAASVYDEGAVRVTDCVKCTCINGEWLCGERNCDCLIDGVRYRNTDTWSMDCNTCICNGGVEICTEMNCGKTCFHNGAHYVEGVTRQSDCNTCTCEEGDWICTEKSCGDNCLFGGETFLEGERRKESCNSCFCLKEAQWGCTVRDCEGSPIIINVSFKINYEFAAIEKNQQEFILVFKEDMRKRYNLAKQNIQNVMVFPGSIEVMFDLVEVKDSNVNVKAVASDLQFKIQDRNYTLIFQGLDLFADPNSFKLEILDGTVEGDDTSVFGNLDQQTIILIAVVACGTIGLIVVIASVCYFTQHAPRRAMTEYGETRLPRASDRVNTEDGFVNNAYQEGTLESPRPDMDSTLPRSYRVITTD